MNEQQWNDLAARLDRMAVERPRAYRLRIALLAAAGYAYILAVLAAVVAGVGVSVYLVVTGHPIALKLGLVLGLLAAVIVRAMWVRIEPPAGIVVGPGDAPELHASIDRVRATLAAPPVHRVVLDGELNAAVIQVPRLGIFGWQRNYLILGVPLLAALDRTQLEAVIGHELGHLAGSHSRFSCWIYRVRRSWEQLVVRLLAEERASALVFLVFFKRYAPYFDACTLALARSNEYDADRAAADVSGVEAAASALVAVNVAGAAEAGYWNQLYGQVAVESEPPASAVAPLVALLARGVAGDEAAAALGEALVREPAGGDTHPRLDQRLRSLGVDPATVRYQPPAESAAETLLGPHLIGVVSRLDDAWRRWITDGWRARHSELRGDARQPAATPGAAPAPAPAVDGGLA